MTGEQQGNAEVRAYLEYFRDLGVYDFYRFGEAAEALPEPVAVVAAPPAVETSPAVVEVQLSAVLTLTAPLPAASMELPIAKPVSFNVLAPLPEIRVAPKNKPAALAAVRATIGECTRCPLA